MVPSLRLTVTASLSVSITRAARNRAPKSFATRREDRPLGNSLRTAHLQPAPFVEDDDPVGKVVHRLDGVGQRRPRCGRTHP